MKTPLLSLLLGATLFFAHDLAAQPADPAQVAVNRLPNNQGKDVPPDTELTFTFASAPALGNTGQIRIYDAADNSVVDTIDAATPATSTNYTIGGANNFHLYPVLINDHSATIYLHGHKLGYHKTYYVQVDPGVLQINGADWPGLAGKDAWVFSTKDTPPAADATRLVVAADGSGDFATVQGAVDFVPANPAQRVTLFIRRGVYAEIVYFDGKSNLTFLGEDCDQTIIGYPNNDRFNNQQNVNEKPTTNAYHRGAFFANHVTGLEFLNLSFKNSTPKGGSQAEALILTGSRNLISHCRFSSFQDTIQINGSAYVADSFIEGDTDYLWGRGPVFFANCELKALTSGAPYMQIRNTVANHGFIYDHCTFDGAPGVANITLARIAPATYPNSEVVLLDCALGPQLSASAWRLDTAARGGAPVEPSVATGAENLHFWEFHSTNLNDGTPADVSKRAAFSKQLTLEQDAETIKNYRDPGYVLGWTPQLSPLVLASPTWQATALGGTGSFTLRVTAAAVPAPAYQWMKNGVALKDGDGVAGATSATLILSKLASASIGDYSVVISNAVGSVTASAAKP